jgi:hypothetical protein
MAAKRDQGKTVEKMLALLEGDQDAAVPVGALTAKVTRGLPPPGGKGLYLD